MATVPKTVHWGEDRSTNPFPETTDDLAERANPFHPSPALEEQDALGGNVKSEPEAPPALIWEGSERPRLQSREYTATCSGFQGPQWIKQFGRWGLRLDFVLDPDGETVSAFYSFGEDRDKPRIGPRSKYFKDWVRANGAPPKPGHPMSAQVFLDLELWYVVHVSDAAKDSEGALKDESLVYSRVDNILEVKRSSRQAEKQVSRFPFKPSGIEAVKPLSCQAPQRVSI
jgi:hypothetical protein